MTGDLPRAGSIPDREEATTSEPLPRRDGAAPRVTLTNPQQQLDQIPTAVEWRALRTVFETWRDVDRRASLRAPSGTLGLYLPEGVARGGEDAFLLGAEFAHHHPLPDGSMHMTLPPGVLAEAVAQGWAIPHPMAGQPTVSRWTTLVYAPRDAAERTVAIRLVAAAEAFARGR